MHGQYNTPRRDHKALKNVGLFLGGLGLCFFFGFFVLGKVLSTSKTTPSQTAENAAPSTATPSPQAPVAGRNNSTSPSMSDADKPLRLKSGPSIDAVESNPTRKPAPDEPASTRDNSGDEQDPREVDRSESRTADNGTDDSTSKKERRRKRKTTTDDTDNEATSETAPRKRKPADENTDNTTEARTPDPEVKDKKYRVQVGAFSTRELAEAKQQELQAQGITSHVRPSTKNGKTLYNLQSGSYKIKANAEAASDKMRAAGFDTYIKEE